MFCCLVYRKQKVMHCKSKKYSVVFVIGDEWSFEEWPSREDMLSSTERELGKI